MRFLLYRIIPFLGYLGSSALLSSETCNWESPRLYLNLSMQEPLIPEILPPEVIETAVLGSKIASVANIATVSPTTVSQGARVGALVAILSCDFEDEFQVEPLSWLDSPTQISLGSTDLHYTNGAVFGNWLVIGGIEIVHWGLSKKFGVRKTRFPGFAVLPFLYFMSPTTQASTVMARQGNTIEKIFGSLSIATNLAGVIGMSYWLWSHRGQIPRAIHLHRRNGDSTFLAQYGVLFEDVKANRYPFLAAECLMSFSAGALAAIQQEPFVSCQKLGWSTFAVYGGFAGAVLGLQPQEERFDRFFSLTVASLEAVAALIGAVRQTLDPDSLNQIWLASAKIIPYYHHVFCGVLVHPHQK
ncbi:MAG: hypothetical protein I8H75_02725 [Myxococcaceae bacterium]|nr:hypothetical protein [Myxococcaceae bacterium]MBH2006251.1 hypothetical protein [Myxococcaceae bacterium]